VVDVFDKASEFPGPDIVAKAFRMAAAVYRVLELKRVLALEALDNEPYLAFGEARDVLSGLVLALDVAVELRKSVGEIAQHSHKYRLLFLREGKIVHG